MTIVFFAPRFYPEIGGVEKHSYEVAKILSKKNKIIVFTQGLKDQKENISGIRIIRLNFGKDSWYKKFVIWKKILDYRNLIKKADIVHCHDVFFWYLPLRIIYPKKKVYITFHGYEGVYPPETSAVFIRKLSEKLTHGNIAVGKYIEKWYGTRSSYITYGAVGGVKNSKIKIKNYRSKLKILFIGRIEKDMGIEIYSKVLAKLKNYSFEAVGDGLMRSELEKYGKVHGFVKNLNTYIKQASIIFSSSYLSILESLDFKKPVFSVYENPLKRDYLQMSPFSKWIYISNSFQKTLRQINSVVRNNKVREKNLLLSYNWVKDKTWKKVARDYLMLWNV